MKRRFKSLFHFIPHSSTFFQKGHYRWPLWTIGVLFLFVLLSFVLSTWVSRQVAKQIRAVNGSTSSVDVSIWHRSITIHQFQWNSAIEMSHKRGHFAQARKIKIEGIHLLQLLFEEQIVIESLKIDSASLIYDQSVQGLMKESGSFQKIRSLLIQDITLNQVNCTLKSDTLIRLSAELNGTISGVTISLPAKETIPFQMKSADVLLSKVVILREEGMYGGTIARLHVQTESKRIQIDSALLIPNFSKYEFAHQLGKQTDRITLIVPKLIMEGVDFKALADSSIVLSKVQIDSFNLVAFRDKHVPSLDETYVPLPMQTFLSFPFLVQIDSVVINHSMVTVEEIPEERSVSSRITFEDIHASLTHFYNRPSDQNLQPALLHATGLLMGEGQIDALFTLPLESHGTYNTTGSIRQMHFSKLNPALEPLANLRMKSGYLNEMTFAFNYNDVASKGVLEIDYRDLQLTALGKDHRSTNEVRTWLLNALVKNDRNASLASAKHQGEINIPRDQQRFIFNIWWKSIRDGLKSVVLRTGKISKKKHAPGKKR